MRRFLLTRVMTFTALAAGVGANTGCSTMSNTEKGVGLGGAIGAGVGTLVGSASGNPKTGAVVGGLLGAGVGGVIGNSEDQQQAREANARVQEASLQYANAQPQRLAEVVDLVKRGQSETVVLNHIRMNGMRFNLSVSDLDYLKSNGVPDRVIAEMQTGGATPVVVRPTVVPPPQTVVVREEVIVPAYGYGYRPYYHPRPRPIYVAPPPVVGATFIVR